MNKLTIKKGKNCFDINIEDFKIIIGNNYNMKFEIIRSFMKISTNTKDSEFSKERGDNIIVTLNDKVINIKETNIFIVNKYYSLIDDFKLTSKSLVAKYLEIALGDSEYLDTINTINILFESLASEISHSSSLNVIFNSMYPKQLMKIISPSFVDDYSKDEYDLSIEELIIIQLQLIEYISNHCVIKNNFIIIECPVITTKIYKQIVEMKNCMILVITDNYPKQCDDISKYIICSKYYLDNANVEQFYNIICDNNIKLLSMKEGEEYMEQYIFKGHNKQRRFIAKLLD